MTLPLPDSPPDDPDAAGVSTPPSDAERSAFLALVGHELRGALAPLRSGVELLRWEGLSGRAADTRDMLERQLVHLSRLVDDLLDLSRLSTGRIVLQPERLTLRQVVMHALESARPRMAAKRHTLSIDLPDQAVALRGDLVRLGQVLSHLLSNAAMYTPEGGEIHLSAWTEGPTLAVRVRDNGIGMSQPTLSRLFHPFTHEPGDVLRPQGGLGVGLTLAQRLAGLHGGRIDAESPGQNLGSTFTLRLPRELAGATAPAPAGGFVAAVLPTRILVVDDSADAAGTLGQLLTLEGHDTRWVHDGPAALAQSAGYHPHVALIDLGMPGMDGFELVQQLARQPEHGPMLRVAVTGWGSDDVRRRAMAAGFHAVLTKPVDMDSLRALIGHWCHGEVP